MCLVFLGAATVACLADLQDPDSIGPETKMLGLMLRIREAHRQLHPDHNPKIDFELTAIA